MVLVQLGEIKKADVVLQEIKEALEENLPLKCSFGKRIPLPLKARDRLRGQYKAREFLPSPKGEELTLGITNVDLYSGG